MEAAGNLLSSAPPFPARLLPRTRRYSSYTASSSSSSSHVFCLHEQATVSSMPTCSVVRNLSTSLPMQELPDMDKSPLSRMIDEDTLFPVSRYRKLTESRHMVHGDKSLDQFERLWNLNSSTQAKDSRYVMMHSVETDEEKLLDDELNDVVSLAKKALSASKETASFIDALLLESKLDAPVFSPSGNAMGMLDSQVDEVKTVRSTRLLERKSKKRRVAKPKVAFPEPAAKGKVVKKKLSDSINSNDPLRLFLSGPECTQLLTASEESKLILQVQELLKLEEVKSRLQAQFSCEPTLIEWAEAVGISCTNLQSQLNSGNRCREKLVYANLRMVVHIAKLYQGRGLGLQDLLQEGSLGLLKSIEKFKPQAGCRFASYAYWWIRQTIRKAIFQHSRTIRLPDSLYALLAKVAEAKRCFIQEGNHHPSKEQIAGRVGITLDKLERLLFTARTPISMQQPVWVDQETTYQEIIADNTKDAPDVSVSKQLMRQHLRNLLNILSPKERKIIKLRYGIEDGEQKSLSEVGNTYGFSKERVRQLENRALYKLKQRLGSQGLHAYCHLVV